MSKSPGETVYEAYCRHVTGGGSVPEWKDLVQVSSGPVPEWNDLTPEDKDRWKSVEDAIIGSDWAQTASVPQNGHPVPQNVPSLLRGVTTDPKDPRLTHGLDDEPVEQAEVYLVLSDDERARGFVRPLRRSYFHNICGAVTRMGLDIAATYARNPEFYGSTYCTACRMHRPVSEFVWDGTDEVVGS